MKSMNAEGRTVKLKRTNGYIVRELLLFVACVALFVFFAANLALLGILFHAAGRSLLHSVRKARPEIAQQEAPMRNSVLDARGTKQVFAG